MKQDEQQNAKLPKRDTKLSQRDAKQPQCQKMEQNDVKHLKRSTKWQEVNKMTRVKQRPINVAKAP